MDKLREVAGNAVMGVKRMAVTICCVGAITFIDYIHVAKSADMTYNSIVAMCLIAALGGVDVWKNGLFKKAPALPV